MLSVNLIFFSRRASAHGAGNMTLSKSECDLIVLNRQLKSANFDVSSKSPTEWVFFVFTWEWERRGGAGRDLSMQIVTAGDSELRYHFQRFAPRRKVLSKSRNIPPRWIMTCWVFPFLIPSWWKCSRIHPLWSKNSANILRKRLNIL